MLDHAGVELSNNKTLVDVILKEKGLDRAAGSTEINIATAEAKECFDAAAFLSGLNAQRYQSLVNELSDANLNGRDKYPRSVVAAYKPVTNWNGATTPPALKPHTGVTFTQAGQDDD